MSQVTTPWWISDVTYHPVTGQVQSLTRGAQGLAWKYDGFFVTEEKATGDAPATQQWSYDSEFRLTSHAINGAPVTFGYDADSLLTQAGPTTMTRDPANGRVTNITTGVVSTSLSYNSMGELSLLATTVNGAPVYSEGLGYDLAARINVIEDTIQGVATQWTWAYDSLGQLTSATRNGVPAGSWGYDARGNRTSADGVVAAYDAQDRLLTRGSVSYGWDSLGGRLSKSEGGQSTQYNHDGMGALLSVTLPDTSVITYEYDGLQRRVAKRHNGGVVSRLVYDSQSRVVGELDANGNVLSRFIYAAQSSSPDAMVRGGVTYASVKDHLGSVHLVVDASSGSVLQRLDYDAWGVVTQNSAPGAQPFGYAGGVQDIDTGFTHFGFRDYDPASGLWTARDPIRLHVGGGNLSAEPLIQSSAYLRGMGVPTYAYAANSPLSNTDPIGLFVIKGGNEGEQSALRQAIEKLQKQAENDRQCGCEMASLSKDWESDFVEGQGPTVSIESGLRTPYTDWGGTIHMIADPRWLTASILLHEYAHSTLLTSYGAWNTFWLGRRAQEAHAIGAENMCYGRTWGGSAWKKTWQFPVSP